MKHLEKALLLALLLTLLLGYVISGEQTDYAQLPQQQMYSWWTVVYPQSAEIEEIPENGKYILKCRAAELWKQIFQKESRR